MDGKWDAYVADPPADQRHEGVGLIYIPDVIGIWKNSQLVVDQLAANGYYTIMPDVFNGDPCSLNPAEGFDIMKWLAHGTGGDNPHTPEAVDPIIEATIRTLKDQHGLTRIGALGYCFGAKYVVRHYKSGIDVGFMAHPSFVTEDELAAIGGPLSIAAAETDRMLPADKRHQSEEILKKTGQPYQINLYSGVAHGFAVRGDTSKKIERYAKEQAFFQALQWFDAWLLP